MQIVWGALMAAIGAFMFLGARLGWQDVVSRALLARSAMLWKGRAPFFLQVSGLLLIGLGLLWATGLIWA